MPFSYRDMLVRPALDLGIPTDHGDAMADFYEHELGLPLVSRDAIIEGHDEAFYEVHGSWLKLNISASPLEPATTGYRQLLIADPSASTPRSLRDPDGLEVSIVPTGYEGIEALGLVVAVNDIAAQRRFLREGCGAEERGDALRVGNTLFFLESSRRPIEPTPIIRRGLTMLSLIVTDLASVHGRLLRAGGQHGLRISDDPGQPGRCLFSFVRDPSGNWIELIEFADPPGSLSPPDSAGPSEREFLAFRDHGTPA